MLLDVILDTLLDGLRLLPFLFFTYLLMEFLEHRTGEAGRARIGAARRSGPVWGALFGTFHSADFQQQLPDYMQEESLRWEHLWLFICRHRMKCCRFLFLQQ